MLEISATPSSSAILELSLFPVFSLLLYGQFFTMCLFCLCLKHFTLLCLTPSSWLDLALELKFRNRSPRPRPLPAPPRGWNLPRYDDFPLLKSALSDSCFLFFEARFMYSSINNPFTLSQPRASALGRLNLSRNYHTTRVNFLTRP